MKSVSERLVQEDQILHQIRVALSTYKTIGAATPRRKGAVYASSAITTGLRLYNAMKRNGIRSYEAFRAEQSELFIKLVMEPNLREGARFGDRLRKLGWPLVIVPGEFFARGWTQEHYMSLWRQVIVRHARSVSFNTGWQWSVGCVEEFLIAIQGKKRILDALGRPYAAAQGAELVRITIDEIDRMGFDPKRHYDLWRQLQLTLEATRPIRKTA